MGRAIEPPEGLQLIEPPKRQRAFDWPPSERAWLSARLSKLGSSIRELSDARELLGLPRLSWAQPMARRVSPALLLGAKGQAAIRSVRQERAELGLRLARCSDAAVRWSRKRFELGASPDGWRLEELRVLVFQAELFDRATTS